MRALTLLRRRTTRRRRGFDEDLYVNVARVGQEEDDWQEPDDSWLDLDGGESEEEAGVYCISACMRRDDSGLEDKLEYFPDVTPTQVEEETVEDRWWSPEPQGLQSEEENEEDNRYINTIPTGSLEAKGDDPEPAESHIEAGVALANQGHQAVNEEHEEEGGKHQECVAISEPPAKKKLKRRMPRKKVLRGEQETWEAARRDAWLRELLTDSSGNESDGGCSRFEESSRWIAEMGEHAVEVDSTLPRDTSDEDFMKGALATLDMLDERVERVGEKLEQIEMRVMKLGEGKKAVRKRKRVRGEDSGVLRRSERLRPKLTGGGQLGKAMLMLSVLSMFSGQGEAQESKSGHHEVVLEVVRNIAIGLEMAESVAIGVEVTKVRATILQRWDWYGPTPRTTLVGPRQTEPREAAQAEPLREAPNCTTTADEAGGLKRERGGSVRAPDHGIVYGVRASSHPGLGRHDRPHNVNLQSLAGGGSQGVQRR
jgi:hypothetical protein